MTTIRDVARESGVSVATVSYVLNDGPRPVRAETRQQVLAAMHRLGYHPNAVARALVRRRLHILGVLFGCVEAAIVTNAYVSAVLQGVMIAAAACGYDVTLFTHPWRDGTSSPRRFNDGRTDGIILIAPLTGTEAVQRLSEVGMPMAVVSATPAERDGVLCVDVDNEAGARLATDHLLALGHTRIAHVMGEEAQPSVPGRRSGFCAAMQRAGIAIPDEFLVSSRYNAASGYRAARRLLTLPRPPTAIFAGNDSLAAGALEAACDLGFSVPGQLSVVGFDDVPAAAILSPPLTTVRQPLAEMGERATHLLIARIEGRATPEPVYRAEPKLVVRGSTAAPPT